MEDPKQRRYIKGLEAFRGQLKDEIVRDCNLFSDMLHNYCADRSGNGIESEVFFNTLLADLSRYSLEVTPPGLRQRELKESAERSYERA